MIKEKTMLLLEYNTPDHIMDLALMSCEEEIFRNKVDRLYSHQKWEDILEVLVPALPDDPLRQLIFEGPYLNLNLILSICQIFVFFRY